MKSSKTTKPGNSQTIYRKLSDLKKLPNNPRVIKDDDFKKLVKSIEDNPDYFEARPVILSDRTGELVIIAGNQRYEAAKQLKLKEIPTFLISGLTEEREKEIIIRDNVANGSWDFDILKENWDEEELENWGLKKIGEKGYFQQQLFNENDDEEVKLPYPITIVVDENDYKKWERLKVRYKEDNNLKLFLTLLKEITG
jgi:hypothetical protein